jgi:hypothetical protein
MEQKEFERLTSLVRHAKIQFSDTSAIGDVGLKIYYVSDSGSYSFTEPVRYLRNHLEEGLIPKHSGVGVAIVTPAIPEEYRDMIGVYMWKGTEVDGQMRYTHIRDNHLIAIDHKAIPHLIDPSSDNVCALEMEIMGKEATMWRDVVAGKMDVKEYLFQKVE